MIPEPEEGPLVVEPTAAGPESDGRSPAGDLDAADVCQLTTTGRVTGRPHRIEIWFAHHAGTIYLLSGSGTASDWVRNLIETPEVSIQIGRKGYAGWGRVVREADEVRLARDLLYGKYTGRYSDDLTSWRDSALPVAVDLVAA